MNRGSDDFDAPGRKPPAPSVASNNAMWRIPEWFPKLSPAMSEKLKIYHGELLKFNARVNLVSRNTEREADEIHFADSILAAELLPRTTLGSRVYDIGSGNGFPGLILAMMHPEVEFCLVDGDSRKTEFLKHMTTVLQLKNVVVMNVRLETLKEQQIEVAVSRGFASISKAVLAVNKCFSKGGRFFHMKANSWSSEVAEIPSQLISYWRPELVGEYSLPSTQIRRAVVCTSRIK